MLSALAVGVGLGLLVAAQVGPISLLLVRSTLRHGAGSASPSRPVPLSWTWRTRRSASPEPHRCCGSTACASRWAPSGAVVLVVLGARTRVVRAAGPYGR
jgi:putative LysE/RhtB family amino acid efflux pump